MMKKLLTTRSLCMSGIIAALYAAMTLLLPAISYGEWQCRLSEAMTVLPLLMPQSIPGLFVGCIVANLLSPVGIADIVFGSAATLLAAVGTYTLRKWPIPACLCPVVANGVIVGWMLAQFYGLPFWLTMLQVASGEAVAVAIGYMALPALRRINIEKYI